MPPKTNVSGQAVRRSTRSSKNTINEPTPDDPDLSGSATPVWSGGASPSHPDELESHTGPTTPGPAEEQAEQDEFAPEAQVVAARALASMRSGRREDDRGHEVSSAQLGGSSQTCDLNVEQQGTDSGVGPETTTTRG
jgi:hypothetical protein